MVTINFGGPQGAVLQYLQENGVHGWVKIDNNPSTGIQQYVTTTEITGENQFYGFGFLLEFCTIAPTIQSQCETSNSRVINRLKAPLVHLKGGYEVRAWWFVSKKLRFDVTLFDVEQVVTVDYEKGANGQWKISNVGVDVRIGDAAIFFERIGPFEFMIEQDKKCWGHQAKNLTEEMKKPSGPSDGLREFPRRRFFMERQCPMGRL